MLKWTTLVILSVWIIELCWLGYHVIKYKNEKTSDSKTNEGL